MTSAQRVTGRRHVALFHEEIDERPYVVLSALAPLNNVNGFVALMFKRLP
jgi:hypothetical protein